MADVTLTPQGGTAQDVQAGDLLLPLAGAWTAHLELAEAEEAPAGPVTLSWLGQDLQGYILRSGLQEGLVTCLVTGGAGGLWQPVPAKMYDYNLAVQLPLQEILSAVGERLSAESTSTVLTRTLPNWVREAREAGALLDQLAHQVGAIWSVEPDGSLFFGQDAWAEVDSAWVEDRDYALLDVDPVADVFTLLPFSLGLWPGDRFRQRKVGVVHYTISPEQAEARAWLLREEAGAQEDPLRVGLEQLIRETMRGVDFYACYPGRVVTQRANGTLDVILDSQRLPPLTSVPYRVPVPGAKLTVLSGSRVLVSFAGGDPTRYFAELYEPGGATRAAARVDDTIDAGYLTVVTGPLGLMGASVVVSVAWAPPGTTPAPVSIPPLTTVYRLLGKITSGSPHLALP